MGSQEEIGRQAQRHPEAVIMRFLLSKRAQGKQTRKSVAILDKEAFFSDLRSTPPRELASHYLHVTKVEAFPTTQAYKAFVDLVAQEIELFEMISIVGTGNWKFSLNPYKSFKTFDIHSDLDVAVISQSKFNQTWKEIRRVESQTWSQLSPKAKEDISYASKNIYSGFVTPTWIPGTKNSHKFNYDLMLNRLSNQSPDQREVKIMYFKDKFEAIEYYQRGFKIARRSIK